MCAYMRTICSKTGAKICKKITYLVFMANVANFALFARALCKRCRICVIRCTFLEFSGLTPSLPVMGADSVNSRNLRELWVNCANLVDSLQFSWVLCRWSEI